MSLVEGKVKMYPTPQHIINEIHTIGPNDFLKNHPFLPQGFII
jgi:hypothetical protein